MTTAYSESTTERTPGRAWTVRILGHGGRTASVTCSTAACRMPARSGDFTTLRTFAAAHAKAHAKAASITLNPKAYCHCGSQRCGSHLATKGSCAGQVVLIVRHDPLVRRVWTVEEVCEMCAPLIPNATVVARAARPERTATPTAQVPAPARPGIAGGFSSAPGEGDAAPVRRPRRASQRPRRQRSGQGR
ncbi:hypothetical protein [Streptomyces sp. NPDC046988]|uniref:hypothetical protein n=1 Tax=Streptomyces sp. NPDC046988 TaxID=3154922 RepID=UPI0034019340